MADFLRVLALSFVGLVVGCGISNRKQSKLASLSLTGNLDNFPMQHDPNGRLIFTFTSSDGQDLSVASKFNVDCDEGRFQVPFSDNAFDLSSAANTCTMTLIQVSLNSKEMGKEAVFRPVDKPLQRSLIRDAQGIWQIKASSAAAHYRHGDGRIKIVGSPDEANITSTPDGFIISGTEVGPLELTDLTAGTNPTMSPFTKVAPPPQRAQCRSAMDNINCYADACACLFGGPVADNYLPENVDPLKVGTEIVVRLNGKKISYGKYNGEWQYLFDGKPAGWKGPTGKEFPDGYPERDMTDPYIGTEFTPTCDWESFVNPHDSCVPGQKYHVITKGGITWTYLFRRTKPAQSDITDPQDKRHPSNFSTIDVMGFKVSENSDREGEKQYAACYFDSVARQLNSGSIPGPMPVPGGRWSSNSPGKELVEKYWDWPKQMQGGAGCPLCHGIGPIMDSVFLRSKSGKKSYASHDSDLVYFSLAKLHPNGTYFKLREDNKCQSCHTGYWREGSKTCSEFAVKYTTQPPARLGAAQGEPWWGENSSFLWQGWHNYEPGSTGELRRALPTDKVSDRTMLMPDPPASASTIDDYSAKIGPSIAGLKTCCDGGCNDRKTSYPPTYYGVQGPVPSESYKQLVPAPNGAQNLKAEVGSKTDLGTYPIVISWNDPANRYTAPTGYSVSLMSETTGSTIVDDEYCRNGRPPSYDSEFPKEMSQNDWRFNYQTTQFMECGKTIKVRVCGHHCDLAEAALSRETGATQIISTPNCPITPTPAPSTTPTLYCPVGPTKVSTPVIPSWSTPTSTLAPTSSVTSLPTSVIPSWPTPMYTLAPAYSVTPLATPSVIPPTVQTAAPQPMITPSIIR